MSKDLSLEDKKEIDKDSYVCTVDHITPWSDGKINYSLYLWDESCESHVDELGLTFAGNMEERVQFITQSDYVLGEAIFLSKKDYKLETRGKYTYLVKKGDTVKDDTPKNSEYGEFIYKSKYCNAFNETKMEKIIDDFKNIINQSVLKQSTLLTYIPSSKKIPDAIAERIAKDFSLEKDDRLIKVLTSEGAAKSNKEFNPEGLYTKYKVNKPNTDKKNCLVIDDVFGTGNSMIYIADKLKQYFENVYFLCICKDIGR